MQCTCFKCTTQRLLAELCIHHHSQLFIFCSLPTPPKETPNPPVVLSSWHPVIYFLSLWIDLFWIFHIKEMILDLLCLVYLISHVLRVCVVPASARCSFSWLTSTPSYGSITVCLSFHPYPSVDIWLLFAFGCCESRHCEHVCTYAFNSLGSPARPTDPGHHPTG